MTQPSPDSNRERGAALRKRIFGTPSSGQAARSIDLAPDLRRLSDEVLFGQVWSRPGLDLPLRSLITIAALTAQGGRETQLAAHIRGGLNLGLTREQIVEVMMHLAFYAGMPAANNGLKVAEDVFAQMDA